ncbi:alpha/beta hydrolase [Niabella drilacis]|uniref:Pimeloyl-ACP methyl ester carboxylesterase n=1 Tax=Niabella drilacis (strain DSM 25811 / CCM 8410 / CCUG 62505 / LMG 26954 / E90) TaxID=1285928 RepID=A0A1G7C3U3_NIADE|nr:alpha/beta fold hydrolase [Niabella drilacis]SDE33969.1 Pimeloyl-ACP methyl ester carboxylesterase [Niabella drilacis]
MSNRINSKTIVFCHGLFVTAKSWKGWVKFFEDRGYTCHAPSNPYHDHSVTEMWESTPEELGAVTFEDVVNNLSTFINTLPEKPILIGHSLGGLAVQKLVELGKAAAGIMVDGAAPAGIIPTEWSFLEANLPVLNPLKGDSVFHPSKKWWFYAFGNNLTREESDAAFDEFAVPESRNIPRSTTKSFAKIDFDKPHVPFLFIAGEKDHIIPKGLNEKNFKAYKDENSIKDFHIFLTEGTLFVATKIGKK